MNKILLSIVLSTLTMGSALGQAPSSVAGNTFRMAGGSEVHLTGTPDQSIDLLPDGTFVTRLVASKGQQGPIYFYQYGPLASGTYSYQQNSATQGTITLNGGGQTLITFSSASVGTTVLQVPTKTVSLAPIGGVTSARALINMSSLITAQAGMPVSFGFVLGGSNPIREILIRAVGPGLAQFGITNFASNPVYTISGPAIAGLNFAPPGTTGSGWSATAASTATINGENARAGAFPLTPGSNDKADVVLIPPGAYTITISPTDSSGEGAELIEVYEVE